MHKVQLATETSIFFTILQEDQRGSAAQKTYFLKA